MYYSAINLEISEFNPAYFFPACSKETEHASFGKLFKIPSVMVISAIIVVASNTWSFLDPTLEPHLSRVSE